MFGWILVGFPILQRIIYCIAMKSIRILSLFLLPLSLFAQQSRLTYKERILHLETTRQPYCAYMPKHSLLIGTGFAFELLRYRDNVGAPMQKANNIEFDPHVAYFVTERIALGVEAMWGKIWGNVVDEDRRLGIDIFARYYLFTKRRDDLINHERIGFFKKGELFKHADERTRRLFAEHFFPFMEVGGGLSNLHISNAGSTILPHLSEPNCRITLGMDIRIWKGIFFEASLIQEFYPTNQEIPVRRLGKRAGIDFVIPSRSKQL
jgi:hypothetical protein